MVPRTSVAQCFEVTRGIVMRSLKSVVGVLLLLVFGAVVFTESAEAGNRRGRRAKGVRQVARSRVLFAGPRTSCPAGGCR